LKGVVSATLSINRLKTKRRKANAQEQSQAELFRIITALVEPETVAARKVNHRRSPTELAKHDAKVVKLATRKRGVTRSQLSELPGFRPAQPTMMNLKHAAKAHGYRIISAGKHGGTVYRFARKLKSVRAA